MLLLAALLTAPIYTAQDISTAECRVGCQKALYDTGQALQEVCLCCDRIPREIATGKPARLPTRVKRRNVDPEPRETYRSGWIDSYLND